jgi:hypothetical protein
MISKEKKETHMNDIARAKTSKAMNLDSALKIIEAANEDIKTEICLRDQNLNEQKVSESKLFMSSFRKITIGTGIAYFADLAAGIHLQVGFDNAQNLLMIPLGLGLVSVVSLHFFPQKVSKLLSPKKYRAYSEIILTDGLFKELAEEEFIRKEQKILESTKEAITFVNRELEDTGRAVTYSSTEGFRIESSEPLNASEWDALRVEIMRAKGTKSIGIKPGKTKELTS